MNSKTLALIGCTTSLACIATNVNAQDNNIDERITVIGNQQGVELVGGSAYYVGKEAIEKHNYTDIHRVLREVPGVNIQEEDGFGLRPNIGLRGGRNERSADITLMEDGILAAPAPYAAPSAYYFPRVDHIEGVEVVKGAGSIKYGPRTTNGSVNLISKKIPDKLSGEVFAGYGSFGTSRYGATVGDSKDHFGYVVSLYDNQSDGFKDIDTAGGDTGFDIQDFMGKFRVNTNKSADRYQELEFKIGVTDEISNETYLGLSDADFATNSDRRYAASQNDLMDAEHESYQLQHYIELNDKLDITTTAYRNNFARNWYKLNDIVSGGVERSLSSVFGDQVANASYIAELQSLNTADDAFIYRANNREYYGQGIQSIAGYQFNAGDTSNQLEVGVRWHYDEEDRFQHEDGYAVRNGVLGQTSTGAAGSNANRVGSANTFSAFVQDEISFGQWTVKPGVRYEHIKLKREDYGKSDPARTGASLKVFENDINVLIPGISGTYTVDENWKLFGGVHKGFAPPGTPGNATAANFTEEEESVNYEIGARYKKDEFSTELVGWFTDYENLLGEDTFSSGGTGSGDSFNGGEVQSYGIEVSANYDFAKVAGLAEKGYRVPVRVAYTYTTAEFQNTFSSGFDEWGDVTSGDKLPYIPENQLYASVGLGTDTWDISVSGKYSDGVNTQAGSGSPETDSSFVIDVATEYEVYEGTRAFVNVENLFDSEYVAALRPAGARPGKPLFVMAGIKVKF
jgi:Fe(3+) dicitrate transport protein